MDKLLRPERLDTEPTALNADRVYNYKHWKMTFTNFLEMNIPATDNEAVRERKKFYSLINTLSSSVYEIISDATTFDDFTQF